MVIGLLTDPMLPVTVARRVAEDLPAKLAERVDARVSWEVETTVDPFEASAPHGYQFDGVSLMTKARHRVRGMGWDLAVCITDAPTSTANGIVVGEVDTEGRVALCCLPALGGHNLRRRTADVVCLLVDELCPALTRHGGTVGADRSRREYGHGRIARHLRRTQPSDPDSDTRGDIEFVLRPRRTLRLLAGLVRANRPWQLAIGLSTALAAALTGSAFGVLYTSMWQLGAALSPWRLASAVVVAGTMFVAWLIVRHGLWERSATTRQAGLLNGATLLTVINGVALFSVALFAINITLATVIVPPDYLSQVLGKPVGWADFLRVPLMATVLGLIAGAVGSGLEDTQSVRKAAYTKRQQERRELL